MIAYGIGGLGADERVFSQLKLSIPITPLPWISPSSGEALSDYAKRFSAQIDTSQPFILIGVSFGGMLTLELTKNLAPKMIFLISSATTERSIPHFLRFIGRTGILKIIPDRYLKPPSFLLSYFFGVSDADSMQMLASIVAETDPYFLRWALSKILKWKNAYRPQQLIQIHGTKDRLLYPPVNESFHKVEGGGHFMIVDRAEEIARNINRRIHSLL